MRTRSLSDRQTKLNNILKDIKSYSEENETKLIRWLVLEEDYSLAEIAKQLEVTPQALSQRYPDLTKEKEARS